MSERARILARPTCTRGLRSARRDDSRDEPVTISKDHDLDSKLWLIQDRSGCSSSLFGLGPSCRLSAHVLDDPGGSTTRKSLISECTEHHPPGNPPGRRTRVKSSSPITTRCAVVAGHDPRVLELANGHASAIIGRCRDRLPNQGAEERAEKSRPDGTRASKFSVSRGPKHEASGRPPRFCPVHRDQAVTQSRRGPDRERAGRARYIRPTGRPGSFRLRGVKSGAQVALAPHGRNQTPRVSQEHANTGAGVPDGLS